MADTTPLAEVIAKYTNQAMFDEIAREYQKGRLLLIGTTDLDAQRPVIWNIGALAVSGQPKALDLFREILRASSAIPGAFEPVLIDVEIDGQQVPGDACRWRRHRPALSLSADHRGRPDRRAARSASPTSSATAGSIRITPQTERRTLSIAGRAIATMLAASGQNDVLRTYFVSRRDGVDYNLAYIGSDFTADRPGEFDQAYMQALFEYGYREARDGRAWHKVPPGLRAARAFRQANDVRSAGDQ